MSVQRLPVDVAEHQVVIAVVVAEFGPLGLLSCAVRSERLAGRLGERHPAPALPRLGPPEVPADVLLTADRTGQVTPPGLPTREVDDRLPHPGAGPILVEVGPAQPEQLAAAGAGVRGQLVERGEPVAGECSRKRAVSSGSQTPRSSSSSSTFARVGMASIRPSAGLVVIKSRLRATESAARSVRR